MAKLYASPYNIQCNVEPAEKVVPMLLVLSQPSFVVAILVLSRPSFGKKVVPMLLVLSRNAVPGILTWHSAGSLKVAILCSNPSSSIQYHSVLDEKFI